MAKVFSYTVNGEPQTTDQHQLTPQTILTNAGFNAETHYLIEMRGNHKESYKDRPLEPIHMHEHMTFLAISCEPTPVS